MPSFRPIGLMNYNVVYVIQERRGRKAEKTGRVSASPIKYYKTFAMTQTHVSAFFHALVVA